MPVALTSFIGRASEVAEVKRLLAAQRLVTLTGIGGVGKSRLALQAAAESKDQYPHGVWLVELGTLTDASLLPQVVASVLGVRESGSIPLSQTLIASLRQQRVLLILDTCEHIVMACASLAESLLRNCAEVHILATSQQPLGVPGETSWRVPPLELPPSGSGSSSEVTRSEAVRLFAERASSVLPGFQLTHRNATRVGQICRQLDGIPLAIELAAARISMLSVDEIAQHLTDRLQLLTRGSRTALPRQQTLRATLDWSYALLADDERVLLRRLAVFEGGWTLGGAEAVCGVPPLSTGTLLNTLAALVDKSLVIADARGLSTRYAFLDTTRQYALERLTESGELEAIAARHSDFYLTLAENADGELGGPQAQTALERLDAAEDNLRTALRWSSKTRNSEFELRLVAALWNFWWIRGHVGEGVARAENALARGAGESGKPVYARVLHAAGTLSGIQGHFDHAALRLQESVAAFSALSDDAGTVRPLADLGNTEMFRGNPLAGQALLERSLLLARKSDYLWGIGYAAYALAATLSMQGNFDEARRLFEEAASVMREMGDERGLGYDLLELAASRRAAGDAAQAERLAKEGLALLWKLREHFGVMALLVSLGASAFALSQPARAARLLAAGDVFAERMGATLLPHWHADFDRARSGARRALGQEAFDRAWSAGRSLPLPDAVELALSLEAGAQPQARAVETPLSPRELEVAALLAHGMSNRGIAAKLVITYGTASLHVKHILRKLGFSTRAQVAAWAVQQGLIDIPGDRAEISRPGDA